MRGMLGRMGVKRECLRTKVPFDGLGHFASAWLTAGVWTP